ncbi:MAG: hypothetical protein ACLQNE_24640 [Thermoguttaceae bacterium]
MTTKQVYRAALLGIGALAMATVAVAAEGRVGVYRAAQSLWPADQSAGIVQRLEARGCTVATLGDRDMADPARLKVGSLDMLVVCDGTRMPGPALKPLAEYVARGGKLMMLGGPFFEHATWPYGGEFLDRKALADRVARDLKPAILFDFESPSLEGWQHSSNNPQSTSTARRVSPGAQGSQGAMLLDLAHITSWETFAAPKRDRPFPSGHTWTTFWAKGQSNQGPTPLMIEWRERDGSRWIAVVRLTGNWQPYTLPPEAFQFWVDPPVPGRGHRGDTFRPENAETLTFGLAHSHTDLISSRGHYWIWLDQVGTAAPPAELKDSSAIFASTPAMPVIETVSPPYKLYPVTNLHKARVNPGQSIAAPLELPKMAGTLAPHARPLGTGLDRNRRSRFVPLIECLDQQNHWAGAAASLLIQGSKPADGGIVAAVPVTDPAFFAAAATQDWLADLAGRMLDGVFLYEAGARYYVSFGNETMPVGALVINRGPKPGRVALAAAVRGPDGKTIWQHDWTIAIAAGEAQRVDAPWAIPADAPDRMSVSVTLSRDGRVIDRLDHPVRIWRPKARPQFITVRDGSFYLGDTPWYAHGVNYMPSSGIGSERFYDFDHWLNREPYDPAVIDRDLARMKAIGFNVLSVFLSHDGLGARNLLDFLLRCEDLGLKVNLSLRPGTPIDFEWEKMREMVVTDRLAKNDTVIAYDLAWEPTWGCRDRRRRFDSLWQQWIEKTYGSIEAAEQAWGFAVPRENGRPAGPSDEQVSADGPWRAMAIAYRRFLNGLLSQRYGRARELMRSVDPNHLVSFRMSMAGDPTGPPAEMTYDFAGLAGAVDIMEPEGYGRIGDWQTVRPGWFTAAYARAVAPELPVLWAEFGYSVWSQADARATPERLAVAGRFYDDFYKMAYRSGSNGTIAWYSAGGYRVDEKSDFGILNPDGSWRPQTHVIRRWTDVMTRPRPVPKPEVRIPIELYRDADGLAGIYRRVEKQFWEAVEAGRIPGLRLEGAAQE